MCTYHITHLLYSVHFCSVTQSCPTLCYLMDWSTLGLPVHRELQSLLKLMFIESVMPSNHLILCHTLLLLPSNFLSIRIFSNGSVLCMRCPKYWRFSFSISPSSEYSELISFSMDWLDLLTVQGTLKSLLQHHSSKASILPCSAFFIVQLSHPYMTTEKTIALTRQTFVGKVMFLLFNMLSRLVITFLPRSKHLLVSWRQSPPAVIFGDQKDKVCRCFHCFPIYLPWSDGSRHLFWVLVLEGLVGLHRTIQLQLFHYYWLGHRLGLLWYRMGCLGNEESILLSLRLHLSTAFWTLLLTMMATPFLLRDFCPQ